MTFEEALPIIDKAIERRKGKWTLHALIWKSWEDIASELRLHIFIKFEKFDSSRGSSFQAWLDRVICHQIYNKLDKHYFSSVSPCVSCPYNAGEGNCDIHGSQNSNCKLYADYIKTGKLTAKEVRFPISLNASVNEEGHVTMSDFVSDKPAMNFEKLIVEFKDELFTVLSDFEKRVYQKIYIEHLTDREASRHFGYDLHKNEEEIGSNSKGGGQRIIKEIKKRIYEKAKLIVGNVF